MRTGVIGAVTPAKTPNYLSPSKFNLLGHEALRMSEQHTDGVSYLSVEDVKTVLMEVFNEYEQNWCGW